MHIKGTHPGDIHLYAQTTVTEGSVMWPQCPTSLSFPLTRIPSILFFNLLSVETKDDLTDIQGVRHVDNSKLYCLQSWLADECGLLGGRV